MCVSFARAAINRNAIARSPARPPVLARPAYAGRFLVLSLFNVLFPRARARARCSSTQIDSSISCGKPGAIDTVERMKIIAISARFWPKGVASRGHSRKRVKKKKQKFARTEGDDFLNTRFDEKDGRFQIHREILTRGKVRSVRNPL